jgi:hypothetical protein
VRTGTGTASSMAALIVHLPSPESETRPSKAERAGSLISAFAVRTSSLVSDRPSNFSAQPLAVVRPGQIKRRTDRDEAGRIDFSMGHVVMAFDMIEVDRVGNSGLLIQIH